MDKNNPDALCHFTHIHTFYLVYFYSFNFIIVFKIYTHCVCFQNLCCAIVSNQCIVLSCMWSNVEEDFLLRQTIKFSASESESEL